TESPRWRGRDRKCAFGQGNCRAVRTPGAFPGSDTWCIQIPFQRHLLRPARLDMKALLPGLLVVVTGCSAAIQSTEESAEEVKASPAVSSSSELITEMHDRYADNWYRSLRFVQSNTFYTQSGGEQKSRWIEHLSVPGKLRIDFEPLSSKSGLLILNNRVTTFDNGKRVDSRRSIQAILTLTSDVYAIPPEVTLRRLDSLKVDLQKFRTDKLAKKKVY